jgi:hypothetical protein
MNPTPDLIGSHLRTYNTIFQHPISHNLDWREVCSMFKHLGEVTEESNGNLKIMRNGQTLVLHRPNTKDVANAGEVMSLRHFLEKSEMIPAKADANDAHWLLLIDHHEARIFRSEMRGGLPRKILPAEYSEHTRHSGDFSRGKEESDAAGFFKPVAVALQAAAQILLFGTGTGTSNEMNQFTAWLNKHHPELARRVIGSVVVDEQRLTDDQLLAKAREFYTAASQSKTDGSNKAAPAVTISTQTRSKKTNSH